MLAAMTSAPLNIADTSDNAATPENVAVTDCGARRKRGAELESAIRSACISELAQNGYGDLTIESVASRAQTGKASIYRRWSTKQDLVLDSVSCLMAGPMMNVIDRQFDDSVTTRDALLDLMSQVATLMAGPEGDALRSVMSESLRDPSFSGTFECEFFDPRKVALVRLLERGVERGEVRADAVDDFVPDMMAGALIHRVLIRRQQPSRHELERMLDGFIIPAISPR
jgi:AcrR family transcriptional regulator